ncbi:hypothetical protein HYPSUDRAFT_46650 [Hypholoma sublateritium FD-334 SS-4]|uniref:Poly(A) RNA polymerase mitochondrial-like central palm domain-containing protein n=1 Tax=Hypholoma sublateritium (strain FD-334 SS-4) TaxID=945553 RepID=A0A0D2M261_HYPSF|nr:hypothetical protein HYPSUDRAFT_46650 [Hypholoma sublateritium FD-334 SS-4]
MAALLANGGTPETVGATSGRVAARRSHAGAIGADVGNLVHDNSAGADAQETGDGRTFASWAERRVALGSSLPNDTSTFAAHASPAGPSAPSPRKTKSGRPLWEWQEAVADLEGPPLPPNVAAAHHADTEFVESETPRGRALESDTPWPPRAPRRERPRRRTGQAERAAAAAKGSLAHGSSKRPKVEISSATPQGQWSVTRDPNIRVDATCVHVLRVRDRVRAHVERAVQRVFGSHYTVEFFGSTRYGVSHAHSDLDMVIIDPYRPQGYLEKEVKDPLYNVRTLATALRRDGFIHVDFRMHSSVPIVKFKDANTGLDCDLNVNERLGIFNSDMIKEYCALSPVLRPLLFRIKEWAKPLGMNMPTGALGVPASFSSYALTLMTIAFLQERGTLPNLQHNLPPLAPSDSETLVWTRKPHQGWDVRFSRGQLPPMQPKADEQTLLHDWFRYWETFPYAQKAAAIRHGGMLQRRSPLLADVPAKKPPSPIVVVDPFILSKNVAIGVAGRVLARFQEECGKAAERMAPGPAS